jgi:hypothetical protein
MGFMMKRILFPKGYLSLLAVLLVLPLSAYAQGTQSGIEHAQSEQLASARGHYARARALLLSAIREFDQAQQIANPDAFLDSDSWRESLVLRATELERVLDPQPRITNSGVRYKYETRLLNQE